MYVYVNPEQRRMFQGEDVGYAEGLQIGGGRRRAEGSWEKISGAIPTTRANSPVYGARAGSPTLRNPPLPTLPVTSRNI
jgi:hypothetical protein